MSKEKTPTMTQEQLKAVILDVMAEVNTLIKSDSDKLETLSKSNPGEEISSEPPADTSASQSAPESSGPEASKPESDGPSAAPETDPGAGGPPAPDAGAPVDPAQELGPIDPMQLKADYAQMPIEDLQCHSWAVKEALTEAMAAQQPAPVAGAVPVAAPAVAAPVAAPAAPVAAPPVAAPPVAAPAIPPASPDVPPFAKSEKDLRIEVLEKNEKDTGESIAKLTDVLTKVLNAPLRKSVVSMTEIAGDNKKLAYKDMTKAQVDAALRSKIETGTLQKSDKDLIIGYDLKKVTLDQLAHLFV